MGYPWTASPFDIPKNGMKSLLVGMMTLICYYAPKEHSRKNTHGVSKKKKKKKKKKNTHEVINDLSSHSLSSKSYPSR